MHITTLRVAFAFYVLLFLLVGHVYVACARIIKWVSLYFTCFGCTLIVVDLV